MPKKKNGNMWGAASKVKTKSTRGMFGNKQLATTKQLEASLAKIRGR